MEHAPTPPAAAYHAAVQHLPANYFTTKIPKQGSEVRVLSVRDNKATAWRMSSADALPFANTLRHDLSLRVQIVSYSPEDEVAA